MGPVGGATSGGTPSTGAAPTTGGDSSTGAAPAVGGASSTGGAPAVGGASSTGGTAGGPATGGGGGGEPPLSSCVAGDVCLVVPYDHCCGATKRAINDVYLVEYEAHPEWQSYNDPAACALIGACRDDQDVVEAWCRPDGLGAGTCELVFPDQCPVLDCDLACPYGLWRDDAGCETCACAPPPVTFEADPWVRDADFVTLTTDVVPYIGGIDRSQYSFQFWYDDPDTVDEELLVYVHLTLAHTTAPYYGAATTYTFPPVASPIEVVTMTWEAPFAGYSVDLTVESGYLSVRQSGTTLEGGVYLVGTLEGGGAPARVVVGGAFSVPSPWPG